MNVKTNGELINKISKLKKLSIPGSGGDETLSIGACFFYAKEKRNLSVKHLNTLYIGKISKVKNNIDKCNEILKK